MSRTEWRVVQAFAAARAAQSAWAATPVSRRLRILAGFRRTLARHPAEAAATVNRPEAEVLSAQILPLAEACLFLEREAARALNPRRLGTTGRPVWLRGVSSEIHREPVGVVLVLAPSNYPLFIPGTQMLQALAAGNAVVLKPSEEGVAAALYLRQSLVDAGLDPRLIAILPPETTSATLALRERPDHILLTGSSETGRTVLKIAAQHWIPCTLELSGCDAVFVRADANLAQVARGLAFSLRLNAGATCIAPRRVFVPAATLPALEKELLRALRELGPVGIAPKQRARLLPLVEAACHRGAQLLLPSGGLDSELSQGPVILTRARPSMSLLQEDLFAPVISLVAVRDDDDALEQAAQCPWALGASIFSRDLAAARTLAGRVNAGTVTINDIILPTADPRLPFGGRGASGYGVTRGLEGLLALTRPKAVCVRTTSWLPHFDPPHETDADLFRHALSARHAGRWSERLRAIWSLLRVVARRPASRPLPTSSEPQS